MEVGLVRHLLAVIVQLLEILGIQRRQPLARVLRLGAAKLCEISLLITSSLRRNESMSTPIKNIGNHLKIVLTMSDQHYDPVGLAGGGCQLLLVGCLLLVCCILLQRLD